jgi:hypothetical protein
MSATGGEPVAFGASRLREALAARGYRLDDGAGFRIAIAVEPGEPEAFAVTRTAGGLAIVGGDAAGAMYGALQVAEQVRGGTAVEAIVEQAGAPRFALRAIKFNLPWMSYRKHECLQLHSETCRDLAFWAAFLDMMADNRFNVLSLWNLHPFHYMIRPRDYPEACPFSDEELADWQGFWRSLMRMAHDRGVQIHLFFWNIFVSPAFAEAHDVATYSTHWEDYLGDGDPSPLVTAYTRACVRQLIEEYPDLDGLGVAMSERMGGMTPEERGAWMREAVEAGIRDAGRPIAYNLRVPHSAGLHNGGTTSGEVQSLGRQLLEAVDLPGPLWSEVKFNWSHGHSTPKLCMIHGGPPTDVLWNPPPTKYQLAWMVRNEDFFILRWGDPDFIRRHIAQNGLPGVGGYFIGSECYIPARDYITKDSPDKTWTYAFERQWLFYALWGRLLYEPETPDGVFEAMFHERHGVDGAELLRLWTMASCVPEEMATFLGFTWDHTLYTEGFLGLKGFITVDKLAECRPVDPVCMSVAEYVKRGEKRGLDAPDTIADSVEASAGATLAQSAHLGEPTGPLRYEVADIRAWGYLGLYFAAKLRAAIALKRGHRDDAMALLRQAAEQWDALIAVTEPLYHAVPLQHTGDRPFSWRQYRAEVWAEAGLTPP